MNTQIRSGLGIWFTTAACVLALVGCAQTAPSEQGEEQVEGSEAQLAAQDIAFTEFTDPLGIGNAGQWVTRVVLSSAFEYKLFFGHAAPATVNFAKGDRVAFYSAGVKPTGGYDAAITRIVKKGVRLRIETFLEIPGPSCPVTLALTKPHVLVKFNIGKKPVLVRFTHDNEVRDCDEAPSCDDVECMEGQHCELQEVVCIQAPCYPVPTCVDDAPTGPFCGGIAGFPCPGAGVCTDDPNDSCDPDNGGADCGGICECPILALCEAGSEFDASPEVCACVPKITPCATVKCSQYTHCDDSSGTAVCVPNGPFCGGIAGFPCPGLGMCVDNPTDDCNPTMGGADCGGICTCEQKLPCVLGTVFNSSPDVCACEFPNPTTCAAVLCAVGTECKVIDGHAQCVPQEPTTCGKVTCEAGMVCCNESCGICTPPGGVCIQLFCG